MSVGSLTIIARRLDFIREVGGPNCGLWVNFVIREGGDGVPGDSWCCDFASLVERIAYDNKAISPRTGSCQTKLDYCRKKGWVVKTPQVDDLCFTVNSAGHAHHIGIVTAVNPLVTIAGNTSKDGTSDNGDGVYEHPVSVAGKVFVRLPK
jgi:hypothetical protein